jgi:hypothetical protein
MLPSTLHVISPLVLFPLCKNLSNIAFHDPVITFQHNTSGVDEAAKIGFKNRHVNSKTCTKYYLKLIIMGNSAQPQHYVHRVLRYTSVVRWRRWEVLESDAKVLVRNYEACLFWCALATKTDNALA